MSGGTTTRSRLPDMDAAIGHNPGINEAEPINPASKGDKAFQEKTASPAGTVHKGSQPSPETNNDGTSAAPTGVPEERLSDWQATAHEGEKTALVAIGIAVGLLVLGYRLASRSRAATRNRVPAAMAKAHKFSAIPTYTGAKRQLSQ